MVQAKDLCASLVYEWMLIKVDESYLPTLIHAEFRNSSLIDYRLWDEKKNFICAIAIWEDGSLYHENNAISESWADWYEWAIAQEQAYRVGIPIPDKVGELVTWLEKTYQAYERDRVDELNEMNDI